MIEFEMDSAEHTWVEEMGGMNLFFVYTRGAARPRIVAPALTGTLLPGVTRESLLRLAPGLGIDTGEGRLSVSQWQRERASGQLTEALACGTAAVVAPIGRVKGASGEWTVGDGGPGPITLGLREELPSIQYGLRPDSFGRIHKVC
jgi:branched-chain amino acid aminotransferase